jgi:hypothetical protein
VIELNDIKLVISKYNKDLYGEVLTDIELVSIMLKNIEPKKWSDLRQTFFDPTCGYGYFLFFCYDILMGNGYKYSGYENIEGLKYIIENEKDREKHIIENMIFGCDIQQINIDICKNFFKGDIYKTNFICEDYLKLKLEDYHLDKPKNIVGNPPFQSVKDEKRKAKNHNLWKPILIKSYELLEDGGDMIFICPQSWMSLSKGNSDMFNIFKNSSVKELNINECRRFFKGVGSSFSYFSLVKNNIDIETNVICEYKLKNYNSKLKFKDVNCLPLLLTDDALEILRKTIFVKNLKFNLNFDSYLHAFTKKKLLSKIKNDEFRYKVWHTPNSILWSNKEHPNQNVWKLMIPISTYYEEMLVDNCGNTQGMGYILCNTEKDANDLKYILSLKLYRFVVNICRWSNWNSPDILKNLPLIDISKKWTDLELYNEFKLTEKQIDLIELIIK